MAKLFLSQPEGSSDVITTTSRQDALCHRLDRTNQSLTIFVFEMWHLRIIQEQGEKKNVAKRIHFEG